MAGVFWKLACLKDNQVKGPFVSLQRFTVLVKLKLKSFKYSSTFRCDQEGIDYVYIRLLQKTRAHRLPDLSRVP